MSGLVAIEVTSPCAIELDGNKAAVLLLFAKLETGGNVRQEALSSSLGVMSPRAATALRSSCLSCRHLQDDNLAVVAKLEYLGITEVHKSEAIMGREKFTAWHGIRQFRQRHTLLMHVLSNVCL